MTIREHILKPGAKALGFLLFPVFLTAPVSAAQVHHVRIEDMKFVPERLEAKLGDTVVWENQDFTPHTATAKAEKGGKAAFDSGMIAAKGRFEFKPTEPGQLSYVCQYHPTMKGSIKISR